MSKVKFTDKELEYIYDYLDIYANVKTYRLIEKKIRKQVSKYAIFDNCNHAPSRCARKLERIKP